MSTRRMSTAEAETLIPLAIGCIFRIMSRPYQEGDIATYDEKCRSLLLDAFEVTGQKAGNVGIGECRPGWNFGNRVTD